MKYLIVILSVVFPIFGYGQYDVNYSEENVPHYILPEVLATEKGERIIDSIGWIQKRRPELIHLFEESMYGKIPRELKAHSYRVVEQSDSALDNKAIRKQVILNFTGNGKTLSISVLIYLPKNISKPPLFVGYNFFGNHTVVNDSNIFLNRSWVRNNPSIGITNHISSKESRGAMSSRWPLDRIIDAGFGIVTAYYGDVDPDKARECGVDFTDGVHPLVYTDGQTEPLPNEWGSISAWAWGLSRIMDYLEKDNDIDSYKVVLMGLSRLGKAALWAGALDQRFSIVISVNSGCAGAALSRRKYGERMEKMNYIQKGWLCENNKKYNLVEENLPIDQHELIALIAPRPVYIASAEEDRHADPKGEYLSGYHATPVYNLFNKSGLVSATMPLVDQPVMNTIGYHVRKGRHGINIYDWEQFIKFSNLHFR